MNPTKTPIAISSTITPSSTGATPTTTPTTTSATASTPSATPNSADPIPDATVPTVPSSFAAPSMRGFRGYYPTRTELAAMSGAVNDLGRFVDYTALLGAAAAPAETVSASITLAVEWRAMRDATEAWLEYVKIQDALAWKTTMALLDEVKPLFLFAVSKNSTLATQYPWLAQLFDDAKNSAKQANATKAKKAKAKATAASSASVTTEANATANAVVAAATQAATDVANKVTAAVAAATPGKSVTVNT